MYNSLEIAKRIKNTARLRQISLENMLSSCGLGRNTISRIANGSDILSLNLAKIAIYLDVSVDYLLGRTDKREVNK